MSQGFLIKPTGEYEAQYRAYIEELGDEERYPFPLDFDYSDFPAMLAKINSFERGIDLPQGFVPSSTYWLVNEENELIGVSNLRHELNDDLKFAGGHIGLGIRPVARNNGYGVMLLTATLDKAAERGLDTLWVHCYEQNKASNALLISCGGRLMSSDKVADTRSRINRYRFDRQHRE